VNGVQFKSSCKLCGAEVNNGQGRYELREARGYRLWVCDTCWKSNWDGWNPMHEHFLLAHLSSKNLPVPERLSNGLLPRES
jgi:hypothetical protein